MRFSHFSWNFFGLSVPLIIAAISIPHLLKTIGNERFGLLALAWGLIGYAGILDLGIGRALTRIVASKIGKSQYEIIPSVVHTGVALTIKLAVIAIVPLGLTAFLGALFFLKVETVNKTELIFSVVVFLFALPLQAICGTYKGVNEAYLNFKAISIVRIGLGVSTFALPVLVSYISISMPVLISTLALSRLFALWFYRHFAYKCLLREVSSKPIYIDAIRNEILKFGGWLSVSNIINPIISSLDKALIGTLVATAAITSYAIPQEITTQSLVIVGALTTVLFPYFSMMIERDPKNANRFFLRFMLGVTLIMCVVSALLINYGPRILGFWLGDDIDQIAELVMKIMPLGLIPYTVGTMFVSMFHSYGKSDLTAKINVVEAIPFAVITFFLINDNGIVGAATAWVARISINAFLLVALYFIFLRKKINFD